MSIVHQYGINIDTLNKFIEKPEKKSEPFGSYVLLAQVPEFELERVELLKDMSWILKTNTEFEATIFVESGACGMKDTELDTHDVISIPPSSEINITAKENLILYIFRGPAKDDGGYFKKSKPFDYREKYWGDIQSIVSKDYAGKRMLVKKGTNASLEFHCRKLESYYIHSGKLLLRLRAGRGEDRHFELEEGKTSLTPPGLMHQRGGLEDTIIIEISTKDEDSDSFLVEDGQKHKMPDL